MLKIISVNNSGALASEYVFLKVVAECNIGDYLLVDSTYESDDTPSNKLRHVFFFPSKVLKEGENILLRTKAGTYKLEKTANGSPQHNLFWGLKETVWNVDGDKAFVFKAPRTQRVSTAIAPKKQ